MFAIEPDIDDGGQPLEHEHVAVEHVAARFTRVLSGRAAVTELAPDPPVAPIEIRRHIEIHLAKLAQRGADRTGPWHTRELHFAPRDERVELGGYRDHVRRDTDERPRAIQYLSHMARHAMPRARWLHAQRVRRVNLVTRIA